MKNRKRLYSAIAAALCGAITIAAMLSGCGVNINIHHGDTSSSAGGTASQTPSDGAQTPSGGGGNASSGSPAGPVTAEEAQSKAIADAGLTSDKVTIIYSKSDNDDGRSVFDISFTGPDARYEYEIDASSGAITEKDVTFTGIPAQSGNASVTLDNAKQTALTHSGRNANDIRWGDCEQDRDNGRIVWDVEFYAGQTEYSYEIDAVSGSVISYKIDLYR